MSAIFLMDIFFKFSKVKIFFKIEVVKSIRINRKNCVRKLKSNWFSLSTVEQKFYDVGFAVFCVKLTLDRTKFRMSADFFANTSHDISRCLLADKIFSCCLQCSLHCLLAGNTFWKKCTQVRNKIFCFCAYSLD